CGETPPSPRPTGARQPAGCRTQPSPHGESGAGRDRAAGATRPAQGVLFPHPPSPPREGTGSELAVGWAQETCDQASLLRQDRPLYRPPGAGAATHGAGLPQPGQGGRDVSHQQEPTPRLVVAGLSLDGQQTVCACSLLLSGPVIDPHRISSTARGQPVGRGGT